MYTFYRNKLNKVLIASKRSYYNNYFINNSLKHKKHKKHLERGTRELISHKSIIQSIRKEMANAFDIYLVSIGDKLANSRNESNDISYLNFMNPPLKDKLILQPVTPDEIRSEISRLDQSKSIGPFIVSHQNY